MVWIYLDPLSPGPAQRRNLEKHTSLWPIICISYSLPCCLQGYSKYGDWTFENSFQGHWVGVKEIGFGFGFWWWALLKIEVQNFSRLQIPRSWSTSEKSFLLFVTSPAGRYRFCYQKDTSSWSQVPDFQIQFKYPSWRASRLCVFPVELVASLLHALLEFIDLFAIVGVACFAGKSLQYIVNMLKVNWGTFSHASCVAAGSPWREIIIPMLLRWSDLRIDHDVQMWREVTMFQRNKLCSYVFI